MIRVRQNQQLRNIYNIYTLSPSYHASLLLPPKISIIKKREALCKTNFSVCNQNRNVKIYWL